MSVPTTKTTNAAPDKVRFVLPTIPGSSCCPVTAWKNYLMQFPASATSPAFQLPDKTTLTVRVLLRVVKEALTHLAFTNADKVTLHGLRRGAAAACQEAGIPLKDLKEAGVWRSNAVFSYVPRVVQNAPRALSSFFGGSALCHVTS